MIFQTEDDILLRTELEEVAASNDSFKLWYTVDRPTEGGWPCDVWLVVMVTVTQVGSTVLDSSQMR